MIKGGGLGDADGGDGSTLCPECSCLRCHGRRKVWLGLAFAKKGLTLAL